MSNNTYDQRERWDDPEEATRMAQDAHQSQIWTSFPAIVKKHNENGTVTVQPTIKQLHVKADGKQEWVQHPEIEDMPIQYPGGGGASWTYPMKDGDEVLVSVASRNMDKWWQQGGVQEQSVPFRMHHPSDGFAIPGFRSQPRKLSSVSMTKAQLRTDDGNTLIEFDPNDNGKVRVRSTTNPIIFEGDLHVTGEVIAKSGSANIHLSTHTHAQPVDSHGDTEAETIKPTNNS